MAAGSRPQNEIVTGAAAAAAGRLVLGGYMVVYDGVVGPWFLDLFTTAANVPRLHYAVLMPAEELCVARVDGRVGHGFTDIDATRHMYRQFAEARIDPRHVIDGSPDDPDAVSACIHERMADGWLVRAGQSAGL